MARCGFLTLISQVLPALLSTRLQASHVIDTRVKGVTRIGMLVRSSPIQRMAVIQSVNNATLFCDYPD